jgi:hypothetical protein
MIVKPGIERRSQVCTIKSFQVLPEHADGYLLFREKTHSLFHKIRRTYRPSRSKLPFVFLAQFYCPQTDMISETLPFFISLTCAKYRALILRELLNFFVQDLPTPKVTLKKLRLRLVTLTGV